MNKIKTALLGLTLVSSASFADDCVEAGAMPAIPSAADAAAATMDDMVAAQKGMKEFLAANTAYMKCMDPVLVAAQTKARESESDEDSASYKAMEETYNAAVSKEEEVAAQWNAARTAYMEANPPK